MDDTRNLISGFIKSESPFATFDSNTHSLEGVLLGIGIVDDAFNKDQDGNPKKKIAVDLNIAGKKKIFNTSSKRFAKEFVKKDPKIGDVIKIHRMGEKFDTNYLIEVIQPPQPEPDVAPPPEQPQA